MSDLRGTKEQQLIHLNMHWGSRYDFTAPQNIGDKWTATARFGERDQIQASSAAELLKEVRDHYQTSRPGSS